MSDEALDHKTHELDFYLSETFTGRFIHVTCRTCKNEDELSKELGNVNIVNLLDDIEIEEDDFEDEPNLLKSKNLDEVFK